MKNQILSIVATWVFGIVSIAADSFVNVPVTAFAQTAPGVYKASTNIVVGTNQLVRFVGIQTAGGVSAVDLVIQNPGLPPVSANWVTDDVLNTPMLGPCTVTATATANTSANTLALYLLQFAAVNASPLPGAVIVPAGFTATVSLDTSTNLVDWQTMTNASFPKFSGNRFFRTSLTLP